MILLLTFSRNLIKSKVDRLFLRRCPGPFFFLGQLPCFLEVGKRTKAVLLSLIHLLEFLDVVHKFRGVELIIPNLNDVFYYQKCGKEQNYCCIEPFRALFFLVFGIFVETLGFFR